MLGIKTNIRFYWSISYYCIYNFLDHCFSARYNTAIVTVATNVSEPEGSEMKKGFYFGFIYV